MKPGKETSSLAGNRTWRHAPEQVPLFDCLTHPTLTGAWPGRDDPGCADIGRLVREMDAAGVKWAFAVGLKGMGGYDEKRYSALAASGGGRLFPVAYLDFDKVKNLSAAKRSLASMKATGYAGVKIHPRIAGITFRHPLLPDVMNSAWDLGLVVMVCTYFYSPRRDAAENSPETLAALLHETQDSRVILLHAGGVRLLETIELARAYRNVLLDLSFTLCKYEGSSLDLDLAYAFRHFDRRICVGSDHPEFSPRALRERFELLSQGLDLEKKKNIAHRNLFDFTGVENREAR